MLNKLFDVIIKFLRSIGRFVCGAFVGFKAPETGSGLFTVPPGATSYRLTMYGGGGGGGNSSVSAPAEEDFKSGPSAETITRIKPIKILEYYPDSSTRHSIGTNVNMYSADSTPEKELKKKPKKKSKKKKSKKGKRK